MAGGVEISADLLRQYSISGAIRTALAHPVPTGVPERSGVPIGLSTCKWDSNFAPAKVVSDALSLSSIPSELRGHYSQAPDTLLLPLPSDLKRATTTTSNTGAQLIGTATQELIEALRPSPLLESLGVQMPTGLTGGSCQLIGLDAGALYAWYADGSGPASPGIGSTLGVELKAKTLISVTEISYQALHQVSDKAESMLLTDLLAGVRAGLEAAAFNGSGSSGQPTGVINTSGVGTVSYGAASPTRAQLLSQLDQLAAVDVDLSAVQWVCHPRMAVKLHAIPTFGYSTDNSASMPIYDGQTMLGLPVKVSSNCPATKVIVGDWRQCAVPVWGRVEVARAGARGGLRADGAERYRAMVLADVGVLRPAAFSVGSATS
jgi:HK97 family phage major capsid protein